MSVIQKPVNGWSRATQSTTWILRGISASGDFSMKYVKERPHRQPLYPALLAIAMKLGNGNRFMLGAVNILVDRGVDSPGLSVHACPVQKSLCRSCQRVGSGGKSVYRS